MPIAVLIEHSVVTTAIAVEATIIAAEVLVTVWLVIVKRLRPSATIEPKVLLLAKSLVVVIIAFHPSHLLGRASV